MQVAIEEIRDILARKSNINRFPLEQIEWFENGIRINVSKEEIAEFKYTGLSNIDFALYYFDVEKKGGKVRKLMSVKKLSVYLQIKIGTIYNLVRNNKIPYLKGYGAIKFDEYEINEWLRRHRTELS